MAFLMLAGCALIIAAFQSTAAGRAEARQRFAKMNGPLYVVAAVIWAALLWPH